MVQIVCNEHEYIRMEMTATGYPGAVSSWYQCKFCGKFKEGSTLYKWIHTKPEVITTKIPTPSRDM
jgi:hypothetical protein